MKIKKIILLISAIVLAANGIAQPLPEISDMKPLKAQRGDALTFYGKNFPDKSNITVVLNEYARGKMHGLPMGNVSFVNRDSTIFIYPIPKEINLGVYKVTVRFSLPGNVSYQLPAESVTIIGHSGEVKPEIKNINPVYCYADSGIYSFDVIGNGFSLDGADNILIIKDKGQVPVCWNSKSLCKNEMVRGKVISSHQLQFTNVSKKNYSGTLDIQISVGHLKSETASITLSEYSEMLPRLLAVLGIVVLMFLLYLINRSRKKEIIAGKPYNLLMQILIDKETDTISISRFQFMVWTLVAVFSYLYLLLSRSLIQGHIEFVDIPSGLPAIILISASTTVFAAGISNAKGSKGAGSIHPAWGNLITNGGVVAPERIQLLVWTIVGAVSFILLVVLRKPENINDLPNVPQGFLELMGVSAAGYLGGKLTRKPGPIIDSIECNATTEGNVTTESIVPSASNVTVNSKTKPKVLELIIYGHNLSDEAHFLIESEEVESEYIAEKSPWVKEKENDKPEDKHLAKTLSLKFIKTKPEWMEGEKELIIINQDGQKAAWKFKVTPEVAAELNI